MLVGLFCTAIDGKELFQGLYFIPIIFCIIHTCDEFCLFYFQVLKASYASALLSSLHTTYSRPSLPGPTTATSHFRLLQPVVWRFITPVVNEKTRIVLDSRLWIASKPKQGCATNFLQTIPARVSLSAYATMLPHHSSRSHFHFQPVARFGSVENSIILSIITEAVSLFLSTAPFFYHQRKLPIRSCSLCI